MEEKKELSNEEIKKYTKSFEDYIKDEINKDKNTNVVFTVMDVESELTNMLSKDILLEGGLYYIPNSLPVKSINILYDSIFKYKRTPEIQIKCKTREDKTIMLFANAVHIEIKLSRSILDKDIGKVSIDIIIRTMFSKYEYIS